MPTKRGPSILHIDIETAPHVVYCWGLFKENISTKQVIEASRTICYAAKWHGKRGVVYDSLNYSSEEEMVAGLWHLLDEADAVTHWNGKRFDIPTINKEFMKYGWEPPSPYKQIDLLHVARRQFKFASNKLDYVAQFLGLGAKVKHIGFELWVGCLGGDDKSWRIMERYNKEDVRLLERLYKRFLPWIKDHPNYGLYVDSERPVCPNCGGLVHSRGIEHTKTQSYRRYQCTKCGTWARGRTNITGENPRKNSLTQV